MLTGMLFLELFGYVPEFITINYMIGEAAAILASLFILPRVYIPHWFLALMIGVAAGIGTYYSDLENKNAGYLIMAICLIFAVCKRSFEMAMDGMKK